MGGRFAQSMMQNPFTFPHRTTNSGKAGISVANKLRQDSLILEMFCLCNKQEQKSKRWKSLQLSTTRSKAAFNDQALHSFLSSLRCQSNVVCLRVSATEQPWTSSPRCSALSSSAPCCPASPPARPPCCVQSAAPARTCCRPTRCCVPRRAFSSYRPTSTDRRRSSD